MIDGRADDGECLPAILNVLKSTIALDCRARATLNQSERFFMQSNELNLERKDHKSKISLYWLESLREKLSIKVNAAVARSNL